MGFADFYHYYNVELADPRTNDWWLVSSPLLLAMILFSYLYFVLVFGPRYMQNRKPYTLKTFMTCYNIFQIISNAWIIHKVATGGWLTHLTLGCEPVDYSLDPMAVQLAEAMWWELMLKLIDLTETVVFVLRKKENQITFLHVQHHFLILALTWIAAKYFPGGMVTFSIMVNNSVHVMMYTYYFLSTRGPRIRAQVSFFKPYVTIIQMVQFCLLLIYGIQAIPSSCNFPNWAVSLGLINNLLNLFLFANFYRKTYAASKKNV